jgi:hypothetical protein
MIDVLESKKNINDRKNYILRTSPIPGPPNTLISSLDEPPLSLIGITLATTLATIHNFVSAITY